MLRNRKMCKTGGAADGTAYDSEYIVSIKWPFFAEIRVRRGDILFF